jgi:hypothetical protein
MKVEFVRESDTPLSLKVTAETGSDRLALDAFAAPLGPKGLVDAAITITIQRRAGNIQDADRLGPSAVMFHVTPPPAPPPAPVVPAAAPK